jgi:hypothetical protein
MRYIGCLLVVLTGCSHPPATATSNQQAQEERFRTPMLAPDGPDAGEDRRLQVRRDTDAIQSECTRAARGDWRKWEDETARYRDALKSRLDRLKRVDPLIYEPLAARDLPMFEGNARTNLAHVLDPEEWSVFRKTRAVVAASRWLRERGIDLIFVAVPSMPEVYIEHFLDETPPDGVIAPHDRQTFLELLESDVEVVNTYRLMRDDRKQGFQYLPADHHWNQIGMRGVVRDVANRLTRYRFGQEAKKAARLTITRSGPYLLPPSIDRKPWRPPLTPLSDSQWKAATGTLPPTMDYITSPDGSPLPDDPRSPVMLIGNSFVMHFRELLIREANLQLRTRWGNGYTTDAFAGFLREPELLDGVRVIAWVTSEDSISIFRPMPAQISEALRDTK